jgi:hypothetical protein
MHVEAVCVGVYVTRSNRLDSTACKNPMCCFIGCVQTAMTNAKFANTFCSQGIRF